jgi:hypothetical protein
MNTVFLGEISMDVPLGMNPFESHLIGK